ncbi:hypothetical protein BGW80DRAFT_775582 [Lactifluus volemus]|nr:hypothetical protein BGW80DRAFT_775582 [Lactifluus volemus]
MRRIASVLSQRRSDSPSPDDVHQRPTPKSPFSTTPHRKSSRRFFGTLTRITVSTDQLAQPLEPAHSSASSTGSVSLRTPEDDRMGHHVVRSSSNRKTWFPWFTPKKSDLLSQSQSRPSSYLSDSLSSVPSPPAPPAPSRTIPVQPPDSDDDTSSEDSSSSESEAPSHPPPAPLRRDSANRLFSPIDFLTTLTTNNMSPSFSSPPLLLYPSAPAFPRSSSPLRSIPFRDSVETSIHKKRLLYRLQREPLTPTDRRLLASLGSRPPSAAQRRSLSQPDEGERYDLKHVRLSSLGLKKWISRPYFEERMVVWVPDEAGTVVRTTVNGSGFGVWALEVSETLEVLAGLVNDDDDDSPPSTNNSPLHSTSIPVVGKQSLYKAVPSPLGHDRGFFEPPTPTATSDVMASPSTVPTSRRGVRFADSVDKEDQVPLGYVLRHRKRREEKALFLRREQERRQHEEERQRHEAERQQWEQEKRQWQKERRAVEEAKRQKQYAEEITAARTRRESSYALPSSQPREQDGRLRESYSRPSYDPRRQTSSPQVSLPRSRNDSSSSSKPGSVPPSETAIPLNSRPGSMHSMSSDDIHTRAGRRTSMISESSRSIASPMFSYGWQPVSSLPQVPSMPVFPSMPMIPVMPQFTGDIPLLPPTAPFMLQQYGRPPSRSRNSPRLTGTGQSRSVERPQRSSDRASPPSRHHRSSSDEVNGRNSPAGSLPQSVPPSAFTVDASSLNVSPRVSMALPAKSYPARRQTAIS